MSDKQIVYQIVSYLLYAIGATIRIWSLQIEIFFPIYCTCNTLGLIMLMVTLSKMTDLQIKYSNNEPITATNNTTDHESISI